MSTIGKHAVTYYMYLSQEPRNFLLISALNLLLYDSMIKMSSQSQDLGKISIDLH